MQETSHNVDAVVDRGVNDPSTDKCKVIFCVLMCLFIFLEFSCAPMWFNSLCLLLLIIVLFFCFHYI